MPLDGAAARPVHTLYIFPGTPQIAVPQSPLVPDGQGNFYGTTNNGGAANLGTVFKLGPDRKVTTLYEFRDRPANGAVHPSHALFVASDGGLIGTASRADGVLGGVIYKISLAGEQTVLHRFDKQDRAGFGASGGLIADGGLIGANAVGSTYGCGAVFRLRQTGAIEKLYAFKGGSADGCRPSGPLLRDAQGNLYGVTNIGGPTNAGTVYKLSPDGHATFLHIFGRWHRSIGAAAARCAGQSVRHDRSGRPTAPRPCCTASARIFGRSTAQSRWAA